MARTLSRLSASWRKKMAATNNHNHSSPVRMARILSRLSASWRRKIEAAGSHGSVDFPAKSLSSRVRRFIFAPLMLPVVIVQECMRVEGQDGNRAGSGTRKWRQQGCMAVLICKQGKNQLTDLL